MWEKIKNIGVKILIVLFWTAVVVSTLYECKGMFFKNTNNIEENYEEYIDIP